MQEPIKNTQEVDLTDLTKSFNNFFSVRNKYKGKQYIYLILGPNGLPLYVGRTKDLLSRLATHANGGKEEWYEKLRQLLNGRPFEIKILEIVDKGDENKREKYWIGYYLDINPTLLNTAHKMSFLKSKK